MDRVAIFIDGNNILYTLKDLGWQIDWVKVRDYYAKKYNLVSANFYRSYNIPPTDAQIKFGRFLAITGFALVEKQLKKITNKETGKSYYKGNLDIELVTDALSSSHLYDIIVIFSGDGDFVPLIRALKSKGKIVKIVSSKGFSAIELLQVVGMDFDDLTDLQPIFEQKDETHKRNAYQIKTEKKIEMEVEESESMYPSIGDKITTSVTHEASYGVFLKNRWGIKMLLPASELGIEEYVPDVAKLFDRNDVFQVELINVDTTNPSDPNSKAKLIDEKMIDILKERYYSSLPDLPKVGEKYNLKIDAILDYGIFFENTFMAKLFMPIRSVESIIKREITDLNDIFTKYDIVPVEVEKIYSETDRKVTITIGDIEYIHRLQNKLEAMF